MNIKGGISLTGLFAYLFYLISSVMGVGQYVCLFVVLFCCSYLLLKKWRFDYVDVVLVALSAFFILYADFRWALAGASFLSLKAMTIGTTGGMLYGMLLGVFFVYLLNNVCISRLLSVNSLIYSVNFFLIINFLAMLLLVLSIGNQVREDILLVENPEGDYQRSGNYLAIYIVSVFYAVKNLQVKKSGMVSNALLISVSFLVVYTCQMLGSNSGAAIGLFVIVLVVAFAPLSTGLGGALVYRSKRNINLVVTPYFLFVVVIGVGSLAMTLFFGEFFVSEVMGYDPARLRMFAYGEGIGETFTSRVDLFSDNFILHFNFSPLWGHPFVDELTTGGGTYIHSLLAIWTHLGLLGMVLFILLFFWALRSLLTLDRVKLNPSHVAWVVSNVMYVRLLTFVGVVLFALATAFFTWLPLWFVIGMVAIRPYFFKTNRYG
ncbi:MAG: hypothetical protein JXR16_03820 [Bermanella sp.]